MKNIQKTNHITLRTNRIFREKNCTTLIHSKFIKDKNSKNSTIRFVMMKTVVLFSLQCIYYH